MSNLVAPEHIERLVGVSRHATAHYGRAVSSDQMFYILHSRECKDSGIDLRECPFSLALDQGIDHDRWTGFEDRPVRLFVSGGRLMPLREV